MLLAVDTSTRRMGVALYDGIHVISSSTWTSNFHHTVELSPAIERTLRRAGVTPDQLEAIGVAVGPGSFTALRAGIALVKGMSLSRKLPVVGVPTLDFLAAAQPPQDIPMAAVLEAGRSRLAVGYYEIRNDVWKSTGAVELMTPEELTAGINRPILICGELSDSLRTLLKRKWKNSHLASPAACQRNPAFLAEIAWKCWEDGQTDDPVALTPIYLSQTDQRKK